jgi:hypothetical protein
LLKKMNHNTGIKLEEIRNYYALYLLQMIPCPQSRYNQGSWTVCCTTFTVSFPGVKRLGFGLDTPPTSSVEVKERVKLHRYSHSVPSWQVTGEFRWIFVNSISQMQTVTDKIEYYISSLKYAYCSEFRHFYTTISVISVIKYVTNKWWL